MMELKNKIAIRFDASHTIGMGHLFRMISFGENLSSSGVSLLYVLKINSVAERILQQNNFIYVTFRENVAEKEIIDQVYKEYPFNIWIYDILDTESQWLFSIKKKGALVVCIDDLKGGLLHADLVINPIVHIWEKYCDKDIGVPLLGGPKYAFFHDAIFKYRKKRYVSPANAFNLGISMGGSDTYGSTVLLTQILTELSLPIKLLTIFTGPHFDHYSQLESAVSLYSGSVVVKENCPDLYAELNSLDVLISGGGMTLFEGCALGLPVCALANEVHEEKTVNWFTRNKLCTGIGGFHTTGRENIKKKMDNVLIKHDLLNSISKNSYEYFNPKSLLECNKAVLSLILKRV